MNLPAGLQALPTIVAVDSYTVLAGHRRGSSIQLDESYFTGQLRAASRFETKMDFDARAEILKNSAVKYSDISVDIDTLTEGVLWDASERFRRQLEALPEVGYLDEKFPGRCVVVPEWLRTGDRLHYGARVYLFGTDDPPDPEEILRQNIEAIVTQSFDTFERYQGRLHGYPDCCIRFYQDRSPDAPSPEWRAVEPYVGHINMELLGSGTDVSIDDVLSTLLDRDGSRAFFAREFFPEPGCNRALEIGTAIFGNLVDDLPKRFIRDYFRLNFGHNYLVARAVHEGGDRRPMPGDLGQEHLGFYLPLRETLAMPRYT